MANKKKMLSLTIKELSGVDSPAQVGARALIMKRADAPSRGQVVDLYKNLTQEKVADLMKRGHAVLTTAVEGHTHLVVFENYEGEKVVSGTTSWQDDHTHPWIMQENGSILIGEVDGHNHAPDAESKLAGDTTMTPEEKLELEKAQAAAAAATALAKRFESIAKFDDQTKAHFNALDEAGQTAFLGKSEDAQKADVAAFHKAKTDEDPVVFKADDGTEYRKSDDPRLVEMAREHDADRKALEKSQKVAKQVDLEKRAGELMPNIPGTIQVRAAMLEKAESIEDEETRKGAIEALKASNAAMDPLFKMNGSRGAAVVEGSAEDQLDKLAADLAKKENISQAQAYNKVLETPEGERLYNEHRSRGSASVTVN